MPVIQYDTLNNSIRPIAQEVGLLTVLLSLETIFLFTSAIKHLFTRACVRSGGAIRSGTVVHHSVVADNL